MQMRKKIMGLLQALVSVSILGVGTPAWATQYTVTYLGDLPGGLKFSSPLDLSESAAVAGYSGTTVGNSAFLWKAGVLENIGGTTYQSWAMALNEAEQVVGLMTTATAAYHAFLWSRANGLQDLGDLPGGLDYSKSANINELGSVVGYSYTTTGPHGFLWDAVNGMQDLGELPGGQDHSEAFAINDSGQVAGYSSISTNGYHAFLWDKVSGMKDLGDLPGGVDYSLAYSINNLGQVAGYGSTASGTTALVWDPVSGRIDLGDLPGGSYFSQAFDINNIGQVVGRATAASGTHAFVWHATGGMLDLNDLLVPGSGWTVTAGRAINDAGQIIANGMNVNKVNGALLLTPVVAP